MATIDPTLLARAKAQIEAHPRFAALASGRGRAQAGGALDPREFGVDYLPPGYVYSLGSRQLVDQSDWADIALPAAGGALLGTGILGAAGVGPLAGGGAPAAAEGTTTVIPGTGIPVTSGVAGPGLTAPMAAGGAGAAGGALAGASGAGGSSVLKSILTGLKDYGPSVLAGIGAAKNLAQGPTQASKDLERILGLAEGRIAKTDPLFSALTAMATAQLPKYTRGE